jgi:hypothetical protein
MRRTAVCKAGPLWDVHTHCGGARRGPVSRGEGWRELSRCRPHAPLPRTRRPTATSHACGRSVVDPSSSLHHPPSSGIGRHPRVNGCWTLPVPSERKSVDTTCLYTTAPSPRGEYAGQLPKCGDITAKPASPVLNTEDASTGRYKRDGRTPVSGRGPIPLKVMTLPNRNARLVFKDAVSTCQCRFLTS